MKECFKCGERKPLTEFYKHPMMADGRVNKCKECTKSDVRANRKKNIEYYRAYDSSRGSRQTDEYRERYKKQNPIKVGASVMVRNAVIAGKIKKSYECSECGANDVTIHGHHDDYSKPLEVRWLCTPCHHEWHVKHGEGLNG